MHFEVDKQCNILCIFFDVQVLQNNLSWCIDKQYIDDKTVMHTNVHIVRAWACRTVEKLNAWEGMLNLRVLPLA